MELCNWANTPQNGDRACGTRFSTYSWKTAFYKIFISSLIRQKKIIELKITLLWPHMLRPVFYPHRPLDFLNILLSFHSLTMPRSCSSEQTLPQLVMLWAIHQIFQPALHKTYTQLKQSVLINSLNNRAFFAHTCKQNLNIRPCLAEYDTMEKEGEMSATDF